MSQTTSASRPRYATSGDPNWAAEARRLARGDVGSAPWIADLTQRVAQATDDDLGTFVVARAVLSRATAERAAEVARQASQRAAALEWERQRAEEAARIYWFRRGLLLAVVLLVFSLVVWIIPNGGGDEAVAGGSPSPSPAASPAASPAESSSSQSPTGPVACAPSALKVSLSLPDNKVKEGAGATFGVSVRNSGSASCILTVTAPQSAVRISTGGVAVWSSAHCAAPGSQTFTIAAGGRQDFAAAWPGESSAQGCPAGQPKAKPGGYQARAEVAGASSSLIQFAVVA